MAGSGSEHGPTDVSPISKGGHATGTVTGTRVAPSMGIKNPVLLPGYNNDFVVKPVQNPGYSPSAKVRDLLSSIDKNAPYLVPSMSEIYNAGQNDVDTQTIFPDSQAAHKFHDNQNLEDETIPRTLPQQRAIVKMLFNAMKNIDYALDNENMIDPFRKGKFSDARIEKVCWSIMQTCIYCHTKGFLLANYGFKAKQSAKISTYAERISKIIELLLVNHSTALSPHLRNID